LACDTPICTNAFRVLIFEADCALRLLGNMVGRSPHPQFPGNMFESLSHCILHLWLSKAPVTKLTRQIFSALELYSLFCEPHPSQQLWIAAYEYFNTRNGNMTSKLTPRSVCNHIVFFAILSSILPSMEFIGSCLFKYILIQIHTHTYTYIYIHTSILCL
jgi:hypothetical protein